MSAARIVIVNYNSGPWLARCLSALAGLTRRDFEVIVVDNNSTDDSADTALPDSRFSLRRQSSNLGFAAGCNAGAADCTAPWLIMLNPDTEVEPEWFSELMAAAAANPDVAMFGSTQLMADSPEIFDGCGDALSFLGVPWRMGYGQPVVALEDREVFSPCAAGAMYRRAVFEAARGFDETFFCYIEDVDLGFRLRLAGERCLQVAKARLKHAGSWSSGAQSDFTLFHSYRNRVWMLFQNLPLPLALLLIPLHLAAVLYLVFRTRRQQRVAPRLHGLWAGLSGLPSRYIRRQTVLAGRKISVRRICYSLSWRLDDLRRRRIVSIPRGKAVTVSLAADYLLNIDSAILPEITIDPSEQEVLVSIVLNPMAPMPGSRGYYGRQWRVKALESFALRFSRNDAEIIGVPHSKATVSWDEKNIEVGELVRLNIAVHTMTEKLLYSGDAEVLVINDRVAALIPLATGSYADKSNIAPALSSARFFIFNTMPYMPPLADRTILVSGCGTGTEVAVLSAMGAAFAVGVDPSAVSIDLARARFGNRHGIAFYGDQSEIPSNQKFDLVVSRHVLEHIPATERADYLKSLGASLCVGGFIVLAVPNFSAPVEPHTGIEFFHFLPNELRADLVRHLEIRARNNGYPQDRLELLRSLVNHDNIREEDLLSMVPPAYKVFKTVHNYNCRGEFDDPYYDELVVVLEKLS